MCERELETEQNSNILTPSLLAITAFLSRSPGMLNRRLGGPASLGHVPQSSVFSPTGLIPNWLNFLCTELYNSSTFTFFLWASQIALIQPVHGQGYILIFLDRMHLLFTPVHFLFWQPCRVVGQYTTPSLYLHCLSSLPILGFQILSYIWKIVWCRPIGIFLRFMKFVSSCAFLKYVT